MRSHVLAAIAMLASAVGTAHAQDVTTSFRGFRAEADVGGDRFMSQGTHDDKFAFGGAAGFDGMIGDKIVIGPEGSYWRDRGENCTGGVSGGTICNKSFEEWGAAVRIGYLITPQALVYGKGGYVLNEQRKAFTGVTGVENGYYNHFRTDGYQVGGGIEYTLANLFYVNGEYKYSNYYDHTSRQRVMLGVGIHFKP